MKAAGWFNYAWPFTGHQALLKELCLVTGTILDVPESTFKKVKERGQWYEMGWTDSFFVLIPRRQLHVQS